MTHSCTATSQHLTGLNARSLALLRNTKNIKKLRGKMKIISALIMTILCCICISAKTVNLADYTTPSDGQNDSEGFQNAINDLKETGGGTVLITDGRWDLKNGINIVYSIPVSIRIVGTKTAVLAPHIPSNEALFNVGNLNQFELRDIVFVGDNTSAPDFGSLLVSSYVDQTKVTGCQFYGLRAAGSLIHVGNTDAVIEDNLFHGIASGVANITAEYFRGLTVSHSQFIDYGNLMGAYYSKTPYGNPAWIKIDGGNVGTADALSQRAVIIRDVRLDEGAKYGIDAKNLSYLNVRGVMNNVSGMGGSAGIKMSNVEYATIEQSKFGYPEAARPALLALNNSKVLVSGLSVSQGVYFGEKDQTSEIHFDERFCDNCTVMQTRQTSK
jgi:hypothetical protein